MSARIASNPYTFIVDCDILSQVAKKNALEKAQKIVENRGIVLPTKMSETTERLKNEAIEEFKKKLTETHTKDLSLESTCKNASAFFPSEFILKLKEILRRSCPSPTDLGDKHFLFNESWDPWAEHWAIEEPTAKSESDSSSASSPSVNRELFSENKDNTQ